MTPALPPDPSSRIRAGLALGLLALALVGCGSNPTPPTPAGPRLVVLYATCTLNKHLLSPYDEGVSYTPRLDAFARESLVFERHTTETGQSGLAYASILTGAQSDVHKIYFHPNELSEDLDLIPESFAAAGWDTWYWAGQPMADPELNYGQGVEPSHTFKRSLPFSKEIRSLEPEFLDRLTANDAEFDGLIAKLEADPSYRAYAQIFFTATHEPYHQYAGVDEVLAFCERHPAECADLTRDELTAQLALYDEHRFDLSMDLPRARRELGLDDAAVERLARVLHATYAATIEKLDAQFGRFVDRLRERGLLDDTLFVFTADHGEARYHPGELYHWTHGMQLHPEVLDVPLMVRAPACGVAPGTWEGVTRSIDLFPTLLGLCDLPLPAGNSIQGVDLSPAMRGEQAAPQLVAYSHTSILGERRLKRFGYLEQLNRLLPRADVNLMWARLRDGDRVFKLRRFDDGHFAVQAFDLAVDPHETHDLFDPSDPAHAEAADRLAHYKARLVAGFVEGSLDEAEALQRLRVLGYVGD